MAAFLASATCVSGEVDDALAQVRENSRLALEGKEIRITYTTIEDPYIFNSEVVDPISGNTTVVWGGVLVDFLKELSKEAGFTYQENTVTPTSKGLVGSSNTACARDVWMNWTDMCVGNSWVTTQRLGYAKVLPTLWQEGLRLGVRKLPNTSLLDALLRAFRPFHPWLWLSITFVIFCYSVFAWYVEYRDNDRDFPMKDKLSSWLVSWYHGYYGFFWSEPPTRPVTAEGRVLAVGFGFFTLIMISSYTASLASVLVAGTQVPEFDGINQAIDAGATVCMWTSVIDRADQLYPGIKGLAQNMGGSVADGYDNLHKGNCQVILADPIFHAKAQERTNRDCDKVQVGDPVVDINCAWPARDWIIGPMSHYITDLMDRGVLDDLVRVYTPRILCEDSEAEVFDVDEVWGVFIIVAFISSVAIITHCCRRSVKHARKTQAFQRISFRGKRLTTSASQGVAPTHSPRDQSVVSAVATDPGRKSQGSGQPIVLGGEGGQDPGYSLVQAFRDESLLQAMPFEKALLIIGEAHARGRDELLRVLRQKPAQMSTV